jgi:hypothetical protein
MTTARIKIFAELARLINFILNLALLVVILVHISYRSGLLFPNPVSEKLRGWHTIWWFLGTFVLWLVWQWSRGGLRFDRRTIREDDRDSQTKSHK